jgi:hypothetical protein
VTSAGRIRRPFHIRRGGALRPDAGHTPIGADTTSYLTQRPVSRTFQIHSRIHCQCRAFDLDEVRLGECYLAREGTVKKIPT